MSKAIELAKECGIPAFGKCYVVTDESEIETFFRRAQAMALRDAADARPAFTTVANLRDCLNRMADGLEAGK